jgi:hypothetical protein
MTSANVTNYYVYCNKEKVLNASQHHLCVNKIDEKLRAIENPEDCRLVIVWPDEHEVPHTQFDGPLSIHLANLDERDAKNQKTREDYRLMKENGTVAVLCRADEIVGKSFISPDGKEFVFKKKTYGDVMV